MKSPITLQAYTQRQGHDVGGVRPVMIPCDSGEWFCRHDVERLAEALQNTQHNVDYLADRVPEVQHNGMMQLSQQLAEAQELLRGTQEKLGKALERNSAQAGQMDTLQRAVDNLDSERKALRDEIARRDAAAGEPVVMLPARFKPEVTCLLGMYKPVMQQADDGNWLNRNAVLGALADAGVKCEVSRG